MTKFLQYLNEGRTKSIELSEAIKLIKSNCFKNYKKMYSRNNALKLYRGLSGFSNEYGIVDTSQGRERTSANTHNYMTLLMDNLPSWKGWPKRSRGLVCSTDDTYASDYGEIYNVIPFDNAKIGVAPENDIWNSFEILRTIHPNWKRIYSVSDFNDNLHESFFQNDIDSPQTYNDLVNAFKKLSKDETDNPFNRNSPDFIKYLNNLIDPKKNGFKMGIDNLKKEKEVWIEGKSIVLYTSVLDDDKVLKELEI